MAHSSAETAAAGADSTSASSAHPSNPLATPLDDLTDDLDFDTLLSLESTFYDTGYTQGHRDGLRQSQFESRIFGVEQGYLKGIAMGRIMARAGLWKTRLGVARQQGDQAPQSRPRRDVGAEGKPVEDVGGKLEEVSNCIEVGYVKEETTAGLPPLQANERLQKTLEKHVEKLLVYVDSSTLSPANTDDDVAEFDDRLKKAQAKVKVVERLIGEDTGTSDIRKQEGQMSNDIENPRINKIAEF